MLSLFDGIRDITFITVIIRLIAAFACGGLIGLERSYKNRPAGFRTHILICIGATIASMTGLYLYLNAHISTDVSRIGAQVVSGLGFIGGGTIIVTRKKKIKGLTTAAGLWASGIIGLAVGAGFYEGAAAATALVLLAETYFARVGARIQHMQPFKIAVSYSRKGALDEVMRYCKDRRLAVVNLQVTGQSNAYAAVISLRPRKKIDPGMIVDHVRGFADIASAELMLEE